MWNKQKTITKTEQKNQKSKNKEGQTWNQHSTLVLHWDEPLGRWCSGAAERPCPAPSLGTTPSPSASSHQTFDLHLWASRLYIDFVHLLVRCVLSSQKSLQEMIWGTWVCSKFFPYKLMIIASVLYRISTYKKFHRNILFVDGWGNLY